jgi:hypothetical protein
MGEVRRDALPTTALLPDGFLRWSDWQRGSARFFDGTERNGGHSAFDSGKFADSGKQSTKGCRRIRPDLQHVAIFSRGVVAFQDVGFFEHKAFKSLLVFAGGTVHDSDEGKQGLVDRNWINGGEISANDTISFETLNPGVNGGCRQTELFTDRSVRHACIVLDQSQNFQIEGIHLFFNGTL